MTREGETMGSRDRTAGRVGKMAPPDMLTGQSMQARLRREVPTDHEAQSQAQRRQLRRVTKTELRRDCSRSRTRRTRADECTIAGNRADQRLMKAQIAVCDTDLRGRGSSDEAFPATHKSGPHAARRNPRPFRGYGGQQSSGDAQHARVRAE